MGGSYEIMIKKDNRVEPLVLWVAGYTLCYLGTTISAGRVALSKLSITNKQYLAVLMLRSFVDPVSLGMVRPPQIPHSRVIHSAFTPELSGNSDIKFSPRPRRPILPPPPNHSSIQPTDYPTGRGPQDGRTDSQTLLGSETCVR